MQKAVAIQLSDEERAALTAWSRSRTAPARLVARSKIVLLAAEGRINKVISAELGIERTVVGRWRNRFAAQRLAGIETERPGRGRPATKRRHWAKTIVKVTLESPPPNATHWSTRTLAEHLGIDKSLVERVWKQHRIQPHRMKTFKLSRDPHFVEKLIDGRFGDTGDSGDSGTF